MQQLLVCGIERVAEGNRFRDGPHSAGGPDPRYDRRAKAQSHGAKAFFISAARGDCTMGRRRSACLQRAWSRAALDVRGAELASLDNPLLKLDNVLATPRSTGSSQESICSMSSDAAKQWLTNFREQRLSPIVKLGCCRWV